MFIVITELEQTIGGYERTVSRGNLSKEEMAIQRDCLRGLKLDIMKRKEQYKRASEHLIGAKIEGLKTK